MNQILSLLSIYKYWILFPLAIVEGPIVTIIAAFLAISGILNIFLIYPIVVLGDITGDAFAYILGRWCLLFVTRHGPKIGLTAEKLAQVKIYFQDHRKKALFFSKVLHGIGFSGLIIAGSLKTPYRKFFLTCSTVSIVQSLIFIIVGILLGQAYTLLATYLNYYAAAGVVIVLSISLVLIFKKKIAKK
jgi:membrane protein DedA with SNARE-associated domain